MRPICPRALALFVSHYLERRPLPSLVLDEDGGLGFGVLLSYVLEARFAELNLWDWDTYSDDC